MRDILQKSLDIKLLSPEETAVLLNVEDPGLLEEMREAALQVKKKVYDNRIVFFAPLYCSNLCVNSCVYCGFRSDNCAEKRHVLTMEEVRRETEAVIDEGHKRLIAVYGEHPQSDADYIADSMATIYATKRVTPTGSGFNNIRRININAAPMSIENLRKLWRAGIGTYQVFQETYHPGRYAELHPANTIKGNFRWRLYAMHRAMDAGIDDVAIGALFGLYDWRFEVMGLVHHAHDLERQFGIGPHTISFPRMQPALGSFVSENSPYLVRDDAFRRLVTVLRLAVPYTGLIVTARERAELRREIINYGCTQTDASSKIGIGAYSEKKVQEENPDKVQFMLGDERSLDEVIRELAGDGYITSFCTAGYRCGRTGDINNLIEQRFDDITKCDGRAYKDFLVKDCPNEDFVSCVYLGEKDITDTSIFYIDYKKMAEENDCGQFLLVLKVSKTTGFAYLMNGDNCYNISDNEKYQVWKQEHIGQFIGE